MRILFLLFLASCENNQNKSFSKSGDHRAEALNIYSETDIDSALSVVAQGECVFIGPTGLGGKYTEQFRAYQTMDKRLNNEQVYDLLKNKNPKIRFAAIIILHDRANRKLFKEASMLLQSDTSVVCYASGCSQIELPLNTHIKFLNKQKSLY
jgi:hypothetical protein